MLSIVLFIFLPFTGGFCIIASVQIKTFFYHCPWPPARDLSSRVSSLVFSRGHLTLDLAMSVGQSDRPSDRLSLCQSVTFFNCERSLHYCPCPSICKCLTVYRAFIQEDDTADFLDYDHLANKSPRHTDQESLLYIRAKISIKLCARLSGHNMQRTARSSIINCSE